MQLKSNKKIIVVEVVFVSFSMLIRRLYSSGEAIYVIN